MSVRRAGGATSGSYLPAEINPPGVPLSYLTPVGGRGGPHTYWEPRNQWVRVEGRALAREGEKSGRARESVYTPEWQLTPRNHVEIPAFWRALA